METDLQLVGSLHYARPCGNSKFGQAQEGARETCRQECALNFLQEGMVKTGCYKRNMKCFPQAPVFELVSCSWHCLGRLGTTSGHLMITAQLCFQSHSCLLFTAMWRNGHHIVPSATNQTTLLVFPTMVD